VDNAPEGSAHLDLDMMRMLSTQLGRRTHLTPEVTKVVSKFVMAGAYDYVAAQSVGITRRTFYNWMARGEDAEEREDNGVILSLEDRLYLDFYCAIRQARAKARLLAETRVREEDPYKWLMKGPGRERPGEPGWASQTQITGADARPAKLVIAWEGEISPTLESGGLALVEGSARTIIDPIVEEIIEADEAEDGETD
jgi:hypothetical protein